MAEPTNIPDDLVKQNTMLVVAAVCLLVGFLGGVLFTVFKSGGTPPVAPMTEQQQFSAEQVQRALALEREVASNPDDVKTWIELGNLYFGMDEYEKSIRSYRRALDLDPSNSHVWTDMGVMYRNSGQPQQALEIFAHAMELDPDLMQPRFNTGVVLFFDLGQHQAGLEAWENLLKTNPTAVAPNGQPLRDFIDYQRQTLN